MRNRNRQRRRPIAEINVVPYIDVMLVLLVIFMITAPLLSQGVKVEMPQAKAQSMATRDNLPIIVSVDQFGRYYLNVSGEPSKPISPQSLMTHVAAEIQLAKRTGKSRHVYVKGDRNVQYGKVVRAMVQLQKAGVANVGLMTQSPAA